MAERRMFSKTIIDSDEFLDMPASTQSLYFHLSMRADDDGFINNAKKIMRMVYASQNDYDLLIAKDYLLCFEDGIIVVKHWRIHNYIRKDRYNPTVYAEQMEMLTIENNGTYRIKETKNVPLIPDSASITENGRPLGIPTGDTGKVSLGKVRINKYDEIFNHWIKLSKNSDGFTKHRALSNDMKKSIDKAYRIYHDIDKLKQLASRFMAIYFIKSKTDYPVKSRTIQEFYGQSAYKKAWLICEEYDDEGCKWLAIKNETKKGLKFNKDSDEIVINRRDDY